MFLDLRYSDSVSKFPFSAPKQSSPFGSRNQTLFEFFHLQIPTQFTEVCLPVLLLWEANLVDKYDQ